MDSDSRKKKKVEKCINVPDEVISHIVSFLHPLELLQFSATSSNYFKFCQNCQIYLNFDLKFSKMYQKDKIFEVFFKRFPKRIFGILGYTLKKDLDFTAFENLKVLQNCRIDDQEITFEMLGKYCRNLESVEFLNAFGEERVTPMFKNCNKLKSIIFQTDECDIDIDCITNEDLIILSQNNQDCLEAFSVNGLSPQVTEEGLTPLITKFKNLTYLELCYNYTNQEDWDTKPPFSHEFFTKIFSLPKLEILTMNDKLGDALRKSDNFREEILTLADY